MSEELTIFFNSATERLIFITNNDFNIWQGEEATIIWKELNEKLDKKTWHKKPEKNDNHTAGKTCN